MINSPIGTPSTGTRIPWFLLHTQTSRMLAAETTTTFARVSKSGGATSPLACRRLSRIRVYPP